MIFEQKSNHTKRIELAAEMVSQGRVIVTDRFDVSVLSLLMGKPHVVICSSSDDENNENRTTCELRDTAFAARSECSEEKLRGYHVQTFEEAINTTISLLLNS